MGRKVDMQVGNTVAENVDVHSLAPCDFLEGTGTSRKHFAELFGFPTLGYSIAASFENLYYGEVWTYLYALFALVLVMDWWSGALRRRLVT